MHRSGSWSRASEYYMSGNVAAAAAAIRLSTSFEDQEKDHHHQDHHHQRLPVYQPAAMIEKEKLDNNKSRDKFAEKAVHIIPFVLIACAFLLWLFSNPDVDIVVVKINNGSLGGAGKGVEGLTLNGDIEHDSDGTQTLPVPLDIPKPPPHLTTTTTTSSSNPRLRTTLTFS